MWTKQQILNRAYAELGLAGYVFDLAPEQIQTALTTLDAMMASWNGQGLRLSYNMPSNYGDSDVSDNSNLPDWAIEAVYLNLATRLAPTIGKVVSIDTYKSASTALGMVKSRCALPQARRFNAMAVPLGAGYKNGFRTPFMNQEPEPLLAGEDGEFSFD